MDGQTWTAHEFLDGRGQSPVGEFLAKQAKKDRRSTLNSVRMVVERARYEAPHTIGRPLVDSLDPPVIKELRATKQIRVLFTWEYDDRIVLLLEADLKKNGHVDARVVARAVRNHEEWLATKRSQPISLGAS